MGFDAIPNHLPRVLAHHKALSELGQLPCEKIEAIIETCIEAAEADHPLEHNHIRKLDVADVYRLREGDYRAIIDYQMGQVRILKAAHRKEIYDRRSLRTAVKRSEQE